MPEFTTDWFSSAQHVFGLTLKEFVGKDNLNFLEIGSFEGRSTIWMLDNVLTGKNCKITCIDSFKGSNEFNEKRIKVEGLEQRFKDNLSPYIGKYCLLKGEAETILRTLPLDNYDVVYVDGSHEASDTLEDVVLSYRLTKVGGILILDDYMWNQGKLPSNRTPKIAVDAFIECFMGKVKPIQLTWKTVALRRVS